MTEADIQELKDQFHKASTIAHLAVAALAHIAAHEPGGSCTFCKDAYAKSLVDIAKGALDKM